MQNRYRTLIIIPKSKKTIMAIFHNDVCILKEKLTHLASDLKKMTTTEQVQYRKNRIIQTLLELGINISKLDAIAASGGLIRPLEGGTYQVNEAMLKDLKAAYNGKHASNFGGLIAAEIAKGLNVKAFIVDPPVVDELSELAKISGYPSIERKSIFHALNQKAVARLAALELNKNYENTNLIVAHLGNGITIGAHKQGKVVDVNNGLHGDGPFSLERAGTIPSEDLIGLCFSGKFDQASLIRDITYNGGLNGYLKTDKIAHIEKRIAEGDKFAHQVFQAMAYQIAKEIGAMAAVLDGLVDGIVLTGELSRSNYLIDYITKQTDWIADIFHYPGEHDAEALNAGTLRVLRGQEEAKEYLYGEGDY